MNKHKASNNIFGALIILLGAAAFVTWMNKGSDIALLFVLFLIFIFLFNIVVRSMFLFKPYFLSKWNILSSKFKREFEFEIPRALVFEKLIEVIEKGPFILKYAKKADFEIFAITKWSWKSWGENIYIQLIESGENTIIRFESVTFTQIFDGGKNEKNYEVFLQNLDESLTV